MNEHKAAVKEVTVNVLCDGETINANCDIMELFAFCDTIIARM